MLTRDFGSIGIKVPVIGQGTWQTRKDGLDALRAGIELGMTHIDTAEMYTGSEEVIAEAIHGIERIFSWSAKLKLIDTAFPPAGENEPLDTL